MKRRSQLAVNIAGIGDLILASKSLRALKRSHPEMKLWLLTSSEAAMLAEHFPYIDRVVPFPIRESRRDRRHLWRMWQIVRELRRIDFRYCTNLYLVGSRLGALKMGLLFSLLRSDLKAGHAAFGFGWFLTHKAHSETFSRQHYVDAMCDIAALTGATPDDQGLDVFWDRACESQWAPFFDEQKGLLIGVNPGGDRANRRWDPAGFAETAGNLLNAYRAKILLLGSPAETTIAGDIERRLGSELVVNLSGRMNLHELCYIISRLDLLLTNDSGPMHIAAATGTPVVGIFGPENPAHLRPYAEEDRYRAVYRDVPCRPCLKSSCKNPICLASITPVEVFQACTELIQATKKKSSS
ncbi:MAG: Lipopolysaccharide core heptosyltransferase RfaQ [Syntrophaceae bacterium PtaU1.Bin231]|nr:MAG: Lipopolysaccharide core heptosyltransferase RfaQ [Syntrophaceae bacterium PtaU1.Bin231]